MLNDTNLYQLPRFAGKWTAVYGIWDFTGRSISISTLVLFVFSVTLLTKAAQESKRTVGSALSGLQQAKQKKGECCGLV